VGISKIGIERMQHAWIITSTSMIEGWGMTVTEAAACGTPCIAYDVPGLRDSIIDGRTGILVKKNGSIKRLAETMIEVLKDKQLREMLLSGLHNLTEREALK